ncbi:MAG: hypothetical protein EOO01_40165 [Chitinophagaceae bacterium]|nr:MAG: hypothetical protein EOO01_40165 [Chitinophagaceae bacterium]
MGEQTGELMEFLKEHRGSEANYSKVVDRLRQETGNEAQDDRVRQELTAIIERQGSTFEKQREAAGNAWPEYEKFITAVEQLLTA